jgi:hypothetical protein
MSIREFLAQNPSVSQILKFVETEAQKIAAERKKVAQGGSK